MQSMQRQFGRLRNKAPGDNAKVSVLLNDYEDADKVLLKVPPIPVLSCVHVYTAAMADTVFRQWLAH